ncbi:hypothetical protein [Streptomyces sp. NPDC058157]|uniref:hypothetical protein n=1 Tax=Streptomyces sp. NPDC058157 TaxID=3346360 RepID=UPI0036E5C5C0
MIRHLMARGLPALALAALPALAPTPAHGAAAPPAAAAPSLHRRVFPEPPPADIVRAEVDRLTVEVPHSMAGYSRAMFPHWAKQYGECDTREVVLSRDGREVTQDSACRTGTGTGTWYSEYDDTTVSKSAQPNRVILRCGSVWRQ